MMPRAFIRQMWSISRGDAVFVSFMDCKRNQSVKRGTQKSPATVGYPLICTRASNLSYSGGSGGHKQIPGVVDGSIGRWRAPKHSQATADAVGRANRELPLSLVNNHSRELAAAVDFCWCMGLTRGLQRRSATAAAFVQVRASKLCWVIPSDHWQAWPPRTYWLCVSSRSFSGSTSSVDYPNEHNIDMSGKFQSGQELIRTQIAWARRDHIELVWLDHMETAHRSTPTSLGASTGCSRQASAGRDTTAQRGPNLPPKERR